MTNQDSGELPLASNAGAAGAHATDAFATLGNDTRLAILLAIWEEYDPHRKDNAVSFSEIFDRVDYEDPGSFNYHLQELTGQFVRQHADGEGYELRVPGIRFIQAVIAGAGVQNATLERAEIDQPCPFCEAPTTISYREGLVIHVCTQCAGVTTEEAVEGYLSAVPFDPTGLSDRTAEEIQAASRVAAWQQTQFMFAGLCPACSGPVDGELEYCNNHDPNGICELCDTKFAILARFQCRTCKNHNVSSPKALCVFHPAVASFYDDHGISIRFRADDPGSVRKIFDIMDDHTVDLAERDPLRATVTAVLDDHEIQVTFDETARVINVCR